MRSGQLNNTALRVGNSNENVRGALKHIIHSEMVLFHNIPGCSAVVLHICTSLFPATMCNSVAFQHHVLIKHIFL